MPHRPIFLQLFRQLIPSEIPLETSNIGSSSTTPLPAVLSGVAPGAQNAGFPSVAVPPSAPNAAALAAQKADTPSTAPLPPIPSGVPSGSPKYRLPFRSCHSNRFA